MKFKCRQPGHECEFDADEQPTHCPVCKYPFAGGVIETDEPPWSEYSVDELLAYCESWGVDVPNQRTPKAELVRLLEAAEADEAA